MFLIFCNISTFRKVSKYCPAELEHNAFSEDYHVELRGPFYQTKTNATEKHQSRTRTASGRMTGKDVCEDKAHISLGHESLSPFSKSPFSEVNGFTLDNLGHTSAGRKRWEEDRSKIFRHKLQDGTGRLLKLAAESTPLLYRNPRCNPTSIDTLQHGANHPLKSSGVDQKQKKCSSVILYSYQNPPFSLPPSGGCRKPTGHSSLPIEFRSSVMKTLPPIGIKVDDDEQQTSIGISIDSTQNNKTNIQGSIVKNNKLTTEGVSSPSSSSNHEQILRRQLSGERSHIQLW